MTNNETPVDALPRSYPEEMVTWYEAYADAPNDKLGHDAMLYLAETGVRRLTTVAYSVYRANRSAIETKAVRDREGKQLTFGARVSLLRDCLAALDRTAPVWDATNAVVRAGACSRLDGARDHLTELKYSRVVAPVIEAAERTTPAALGWFEACKVIVDYRNQTLGHPDPNVLRAKHFYREMTPLVAAAVADLLWDEHIKAVFERYPVARYVSLDEPNVYTIRHRTESFGKRVTLLGAGASDYRDDRGLIVRIEKDGSSTFLAVERDPEEPGATGVRAVGVASASGWETVVAGPRADGAASAEAQLPGPVPGEAGGVAPAPLARTYGEASMVMVPAASFRTDAGGAETEVVLIRPFLISRYPVLQSEYEAVMDANPSVFVGGRHPVDSVSWFDAVRFCNRFSELALLDSVYDIVGSEVSYDLAKDGYRLPTECEWEFACRGGPALVGYGPIDDGFWHVKNPNTKSRTHEVGGSVNGLGIVDMLGNVWEWCNDWWSQRYPAPGQQDPAGPADGASRVLRGGSFTDLPSLLTPSTRGKDSPSSQSHTYGFRLARSVAPEHRH